MRVTVVPTAYNLAWRSLMKPSNLYQEVTYAFYSGRSDDFVPNMDDMMPMHGLTSAWFGRRTRSFGRGGRRGTALVDACPALGGIIMAD